MAGEQTQKAGRDAATMTAALALGLISAGLLFLMAIVLPNLIAVIGLVAGMGLLIGFHYLVWGRWLKFPTEEDVSTEPGATPQPLVRSAGLAAENFDDQP